MQKKKKTKERENVRARQSVTGRLDAKAFFFLIVAFDANLTSVFFFQTT